MRTIRRPKSKKGRESGLERGFMPDTLASLRRNYPDQVQRVARSFSKPALSRNSPSEITSIHFSGTAECRNPTGSSFPAYRTTSHPLS